jgi:adenylosuccinate lyase
MFAKVDFDAVLHPRLFVGRAPEQVTEFLSDQIEPIRNRYAGRLGGRVELTV